MKLKHVFLFSFGLIVTWLAVSCQSGTKPTIATLPPVTVTGTTLPQSSLMPPSTDPVPTATATIKAEKTSDSVLEPTSLPTVALETATPLPLLSTPTITAVTLTPLSTFTAPELEGAVAELLENPMNCDVPCWWGAIPGFTRFNEIKHATAPYNFHVSQYKENWEVVYLLIETGYVEEQDNYEIGIVYNFSHSKLVGITAYSSPISQFLDKFGQPDEIWLSTISFERGDLPVWLNLVYIQEGMAVGYLVDGDIRDDMVTGCFADKETGRLRLLVPNDATNYKVFTPVFELDRRYLSLEEATSLTIDDFMQQFSDPSQPQCIETPTELWE